MFQSLTRVWVGALKEGLDRSTVGLLDAGAGFVGTAMGQLAALLHSKYTVHI